MVSLGEEQYGESTKRSGYIAVIGLLVLSVGLLWAANGIQQHPVHRIAFPSILVVSGVAFVGILTKKMSLGVAEWLFLIGSGAVLIPALLLWRTHPSPDVAHVTSLVVAMIWLGPVYPLCFLMFGTRRGLRMCLVFYMGFVLIMWRPVLTDILAGGQTPLETTIAISLFGTFGIMIVFLWLLASRLEALIAARTAARIFETQAITDPLTGIANRRRLDDELERLLARFHRYGEPLSAIMIDLDRFKEINDRFGHDAGDEALVEVVDRLSAIVREEDLLGRWGGEEFLLLAPHADHADAFELAERCRQTIANRPMQKIGHVTASFGVATLTSSDDPRTLLRRADRALFDAKTQGRNRVVGAA